MAKKELSLQRKYLSEENRKWPDRLTNVHRDYWPKDGQARRAAVWRSRTFLVQVYFEDVGVMRMSVCRTELDGAGMWKDGISWEELQRLKDECGYGCSDAVEVYPRNMDVVNVANMRHVWVLPYPLPFAWRGAKSPNDQAERQEERRQ
jgi:hypothetical protein